MLCMLGRVIGGFDSCRPLTTLIADMGQASRLWRRCLHTSLSPCLVCSACRPGWQWLCGGVTLRDALLVGTWAAFNAAWLATILTGALRSLPPEANVARIVAKGLAALTLPNLVLLFFPVSR